MMTIIIIGYYYCYHDKALIINTIQLNNITLNIFKFKFKIYTMFTPSQYSVVGYNLQASLSSQVLSKIIH